MAIKETLKKWFFGNKSSAVRAGNVIEDPLREFIYLDEVSLRSLLTSQTGGLKDSVSETSSKAEDAEIAAEISADAMVSKGKINSRYQTSNSRSIQTSRKAIAQSWFKEFRDLQQSKIHLSSPVQGKQFDSKSELLSCSDCNVVLCSDQLKRGVLIEIDVELAVDPVFKMSTLISEFLGMTKSIPKLAEMANVSQQLRDIDPVNSLLQHLLAGLIPLRAKAINYCVIQDGEKEYIVHNDAIKDMDIKRYSLEVVGVTEHLSYWKDIRRVLFSQVQFTMLCRVSRDGIHRTWTPVKLVELYDDVAPDVRRQIDSIGEISLIPSAPSASPESQKRELLENTFIFFYDKCLIETGNQLSESKKNEDYVFIKSLVSNIDVNSITAQNEISRDIAQRVNNDIGDSLMPGKVCELWKEARLRNKLEFFDNSTSTAAVLPQSSNDKNSDDIQHRIIDTEVIAIYW